VQEAARAGQSVVLHLHWQEQAGPQDFFQVLTFRDTKVVHIQDCPSQRDAFKRAGISRSPSAA
jgi:hypothetical protein